MSNNNSRRIQPISDTQYTDDKFVPQVKNVSDVLKGTTNRRTLNQQRNVAQQGGGGGQENDLNNFLTAIMLNVKQSFQHINIIYDEISGGNTNTISISNFDSTIIDDLSDNLNELTDDVNELSGNVTTNVNIILNKFDTFEDYFTKKPYLLISPSYENPLPANNNTIRLSWSLPEPKPKKAALNFIGSNHDIAGTDINVSLIDSDVQTLLNTAKIDLTNYNYLPYFDSINIDYRKKSDPGNWITISTNEIRLNGSNNSSPELYPHTERVEIKLGTANNIGTYDYSNNKLIYKNENLFPINTEEYQFRVYLKNQNDDTVSPLGYTDSHGIQDPLWRYLYIPDNSSQWISLPSRGAATSPLLIQLALQSYRTLNITGANNNPNSTNPEAEIGLNTLFSDLASNSLHVNYGFDLSGSRSNSSKQAIPINSSYNNIFQSYQSNSLTVNSWNINNNSHFSPSSSIDPMQTSNSIIFPGYNYQLNNYYMKINTDESGNVYSTNYPSNTPYPSITISNPSRSNVTSGTSNYDNFVSSNTSFYQVNSGSGYIVSTAYPNNSGSSISNIHFVDPGDTFQLSSNTTYKIKCARDNNDTLFGTDLSAQNICFFNFSTNAAIPTDLNGAMRIGFTGNDSAGIRSNNFFEFNESETKDAAYLTGENAAEQYRRQGWYLGVDLQDLKVKDIKLANYPDICNNNYNPWNILFEQRNDSNNSLGSSSLYELKIAQKPTQDIALINYTISHNVSTSLTYYDFFGLKHIYDIINITIAGDFINLNPDWRTHTNITHDAFKLKINNSTILDTQHITWPTGGNTNKNFTETLTVIINDFTNSNRHYSRGLSNHFSIDGSHRNNVTRTPQTYTINSQNITFDGKNLIWDYTWDINSNGSRKILPNINWNSEIELMNIGPGLYPDSINNFSSFNTQINHSNSLLDHQLMWANHGYRSGNYSINVNDNPYINYGVFYNNTIDYSSFDNSGTSVTANDILMANTGLQLIPMIPVLSSIELAGIYKWLVFKAVRLNITGNIKVNVYGTSGSGNLLTLGHDYLLYVLEDNPNLWDSPSPPGFPEPPARSGWRSAQLKYNIAKSLPVNIQNGEGIYNTDNTNYPIQIFSNAPNIPIYYRIGLKNGNNKKIHHITIDYEPV